MKNFAYKAPVQKKAPTNRTDKADNRSIVSFVGSVPEGIEKTKAPISRKTPLKQVLFLFLTDRIELVPRGFCLNEPTYWASVNKIYVGLRVWCKEHRLFYPSFDEFQEAMRALFPEPQAKYCPHRKQWWGFRFHEEPINENHVVIRRKLEKESEPLSTGPAASEGKESPNV